VSDLFQFGVRPDFFPVAGIGSACHGSHEYIRSLFVQANRLASGRCGGATSTKEDGTCSPTEAEIFLKEIPKICGDRVGRLTSVWGEKKNLRTRECRSERNECYNSLLRISSIPTAGA
jgi:hypothetical protein